MQILAVAESGSDLDADQDQEEKFKNFKLENFLIRSLI